MCMNPPGSSRNTIVGEANEKDIPCHVCLYTKNLPTQVIFFMRFKSERPFPLKIPYFSQKRNKKLMNQVT